MSPSEIEFSFTSGMFSCTQISFRHIFTFLFLKYSPAQGETFGHLICLINDNLCCQILCFIPTSLVSALRAILGQDSGTSNIILQNKSCNFSHISTSFVVAPTQVPAPESREGHHGLLPELPGRHHSPNGLHPEVLHYRLHLEHGSFHLSFPVSYGCLHTGSDTISM